MPDARIAAATDLASLADRFWDGFLRANPAFATVVAWDLLDEAVLRKRSQVVAAR